MSRRKWSAKVSMRDSFVASENGPGGTVVGRRKRRMCLFHVLAQPQIGTAPGRYKHCAKANRTRRTVAGVPHPRVFCQKRLQTIENKELQPRKERQEIPRGGKLMKEQGLSRMPTWMRGTIG